MDLIKEFLSFLAARGRGLEWQDLASELLPQYLQDSNEAQDQLAFTRSFAALRIAGNDDAYRQLVILFWFENYRGNHESASYLLTMLGTVGVIESQKARLSELQGETLAEQVFGDLDFPALGSDLADYPDKINLYLRKLRQNLDEAACRKVLAGNHHQLDPEQFAEEKRLFTAASSLAEYLRQKHERLVGELAKHAANGTLWFEQRITPRVVDYVREHQEIQTGVLQANRLIVRKIPYDPDAWLGESDPDKQRYLACHCPFVRESIPAGTRLSSLWCHCTGGFTKLLWDYIFDQPLEVELLESVLDGDSCCRFAIILPIQASL